MTLLAFLAWVVFGVKVTSGWLVVLMVAIILDLAASRS